VRILVTGGHGFVGSHLLPKLQEEGHAVIAPTKDQIDLVHGDCLYGAVSCLADMCQYRDIEAIIHLAATVDGLPGNIGNQGKFMHDNLLMGVHVLEAARLAEVAKVVNLGSVCGYHSVGPKPFKEENYWTGLPHESNRGYGMAKRATIMMGIEYNRQYGMDVTNLVPINLVGEGDVSTHVCVDLIKKFEEAKNNDDGPVTLWGRGTATREFCYAGDLADAIVMAVGRDVGPWPINIGTGREISIADLANLIREIGGYKSHIIWDHSKPEGQGSRRLDISRAKELLGWEPKTSLREALKRTIEWNRERLS